MTVPAPMLIGRGEIQNNQMRRVIKNKKNNDTYVYVLNRKESKANKKANLKHEPRRLRSTINRSITDHLRISDSSPPDTGFILIR